jgi:protein-S-isoprenylcysteine O-methyltransferase Ste14
MINKILFWNLKPLAPGELTQTERLLAQRKEQGRMEPYMSLREMLLAAITVMVIGTMLFNLIESNSDYALFMYLGLVLSIIGLLGSIKYARELVQATWRDQQLHEEKFD